MEEMKRLNRLLADNTYTEFLQRTQTLEKERVFCRHGFDHLWAVARVAYIYLLEQEVCKEGSRITKEIIYTAAFLHDLGRWVQYETGEDHAQASARLAQPLLLKYGYNTEEIEQILEAVINHRRGGQTLPPLAKAIALADDWSRDCRNCQAKNECYKYTPTMVEIVY